MFYLHIHPRKDKKALYNATKSGLDTLDQKPQKNTNAFVLYNSSKENQSITRNVIVIQRFHLVNMPDILSLRQVDSIEDNKQFLEVLLYICPSKIHRKTKLLYISCNKPNCLPD